MPCLDIYITCLSHLQYSQCSCFSAEKVVYMYWVTQKLLQIYTANHATFPIRIIRIRKIKLQYKFAVISVSPSKYHDVHVVEEWPNDNWWTELLCSGWPDIQGGERPLRLVQQDERANTARVDLPTYHHLLSSKLPSWTKKIFHTCHLQGLDLLQSNVWFHKASRLKYLHNQNNSRKKMS